MNGKPGSRRALKCRKEALALQRELGSRISHPILVVNYGVLLASKSGHQIRNEKMGSLLEEALDKD